MQSMLNREGEDDKIALEKLLPSMSTKIKRAIQNGTFIIDYIGGAGNLPYKLSFYRNLQCKYHVLWIMMMREDMRVARLRGRDCLM